MYGRDVTAILIAMMLLVGAGGAAGGQDAPRAKTALSIKCLTSGSPGARLANLECLSAARAGRSQPTSRIDRTAELVYAGIDGRAIIARAKIILLQWKNSLLLSYQRFPAIVIGLGGLVVLPLLALPGLVLRIARRIGRRFAPRTSQSKPALQHSEPAPRQGPCWIEVEGAGAGAGAGVAKARLDGEMLRIGRERDNDICLDARSVHRYHALVHRTSEEEVLITDLSGEHGNGMWVNGTRLQSVVLRHGDRIQLGQVRLRYEMGRV